MTKKILFLDSPAFGKEDMAEAFTSLGYELVRYYHNDVFDRYNQDVEKEITDIINGSGISFAFSFNFYPLLSVCCQKTNIKYLSHTYDSPFKSLFSTTIINSCNYAFVFDKATYTLFHNEGINTVYYLPMMANVDRLDKLVVSTQDIPTVSSEVAFVGSLYNEDLKHNLFDRLESNLDEYTKGYLHGIIQSQLQIQGSNIIEDCLSPSIIEAMYKSMPYEAGRDGVETLSYIYAHYFIDFKVTALERTQLLKAISENFDLKLYTHYQPVEIPKATFMGPIDWEESMPAVFKNSKININITLRSIITGMPLRVFDILGAGGFLISNYQEDFLDYFVPDEDIVFYFDQNDLLNKIEYYLSHEKERLEIAENAYQKVKQNHTYLCRATEMLQIAELM